MNFHFIWYLRNDVCFCIPRIWRGYVKKKAGFINTVNNEHSFPDSFYHTQDTLGKKVKNLSFIEFNYQFYYRNCAKVGALRNMRS